MHFSSVNDTSCQMHRFKLIAYACFIMKCTAKNNQNRSTTFSLSPNLTACHQNEQASLPCSTFLLSKPSQTGAVLHLFGAALSFFPALGSVFFTWAAAAAVFWLLSLGVLCAALEAAATGWAGLPEGFEACVGFEVVLEGCRRRLPSSPAEDEWRLLLPPSSPIGGCGHTCQRSIWLYVKTGLSLYNNFLLSFSAVDTYFVSKVKCSEIINYILRTIHRTL